MKQSHYLLNCRIIRQRRTAKNNRTPGKELLDRVLLYRHIPNTYPAKPFSLPFRGEELCSIGLPVAVRRTLLGVGSYHKRLKQLRHTFVKAICLRCLEPSAGSGRSNQPAPFLAIYLVIYQYPFHSNPLIPYYLI